MRDCRTLTMIAIAHSKTARSGLVRTHATLGRLMPLLSQWDGTDKKTGSEAFEALRAAYEADIGDIKAKRLEAETAWARAHDMDGGPLHPDSAAGSIEASICVRIDGNVPRFLVYEKPKKHENREASKYSLTFSAVALVAFLVQETERAQAVDSSWQIRQMAFAALAGGVAVALRKIFNGIVRFHRFTPNEFYKKVAQASEAVRLTLASIRLDCGETVQDMETDSEK